jgi:small subunit ribosomal protein S9
MENNIIATIGKRKTSIAKIFFEKGNYSIKVNNKEFDKFFIGVLDQSKKVNDLLAKLSNYKITITVKGGGIMGQLSAILLGLAKFIAYIDPNIKTELKKKKLLTRDARIKERRKYGLKKARKASQYSKR